MSSTLGVLFVVVVVATDDTDDFAQALCFDSSMRSLESALLLPVDVADELDLVDSLPLMLMGRDWACGVGECVKWVKCIGCEPLIDCGSVCVCA